MIRSIEAYGKAAHWQRFPKIGYYSETHFPLKGSREFSRDEIEAADYLHAIPIDQIATSGGHLDSGALLTQPKSVKRRVRLGRVWGSGTSVCNEDLRRTLEGESLTGLKFRDVAYDYKGTKQYPPIWQLWSDVVLPKLRNPLHICEEGSGAGFHINDLYSPPIPTFDVDSFKRLGDFDVAITTERLGGGIDKARDPLFIVSKHARTVLDQLKLSLNYIPIRQTNASNKAE
ncbi:MAG: hypothetical protein P1U86_20050 [Verrucomicrobiales bacterium]|nr:hypothetical protein [Verrucomicrobiales bacterium]